MARAPRSATKSTTTYTTKPKPKAKRGRPRIEVESYYAEIETWELRYSFAGAEGRPHCDTVFGEYAVIEIRGRFLSPAKLAGKDVQIHISGDRQYDVMMNHPEKFDQKAKGVAFLEVWGERRELLGTYPWSALWGLVPAIQSGVVKIVSMYGEPLNRGRALIRSLAFFQSVDPEDL